MGSDEVSYATQSASNAVVQLGKNSIKCDILRENMYHAEERLYVAFDKENVDDLLSHFKQQGKDAFSTSKSPVHFRLKFSYFRSLKESIQSIDGRKDAISRILPTPTSFIATQTLESDLLAHYKDDYWSPDQYEALQVIASAPASGPPVLIAGPFGTGKTRVLALAAHYFLHESIAGESRLAILVCTQQQTSADAYLEMYNDLTIAPEEIAIIRLVPKYYSQRNSKCMKTVDRFKKEMERNSHRSLQRYLIVTTCLTAKYIADVLPQRFFTHIFLDEGAQMREPEAVAPLCMASKNTKLVIAGDRFQVSAHHNLVMCMAVPYIA